MRVNSGSHGCAVEPGSDANANGWWKDPAKLDLCVYRMKAFRTERARRSVAAGVQTSSLYCGTDFRTYQCRIGKRSTCRQP